MGDPELMPTRESLGGGLGYIAGTVSSIRGRDPELARQLQWIYDNVDKPKFTKQEMDDAVNWALADTLRRNSLLDVLRIVCMVRWGSLGKTLAEKSRSAAASQEGTNAG